jgi:hypothetical protein
MRCEVSLQRDAELLEVAAQLLVRRARGRWGEQGGRDEGGEATGMREGPSSHAQDTREKALARFLGLRRAVSSVAVR